MADFTYLLPYTPNSIVPIATTVDTAKYYLLGPVLSKAPITAGSFKIGATYKINVVGVTDFTLLGAANNNVGTMFVTSGRGTKIAGCGNAFELSAFLLPKISTKVRDSTLYKNSHVGFLIYNTGSEYTSPTKAIQQFIGSGIWISPIKTPEVSGSRGGNAALASLLIALSDADIIIDSSTA